MNRMVAVSPDQLTAVWPSIRAEVETIEAPDGFIPEDVYAMCKGGQAALILLEVDGVRVGWVVGRMIGTDLHIWMLKADNGYDVMRTFRPQLMDMARGANAKKITYGSTRKAWAKVSQEHRFKVRMIVYETDVEPPPAPELPAANDSNNSEVATQ
jgi:hypothetical protein